MSTASPASNDWAMINALFNQPTYTAVKRMMDVTALRQEAISSNITHLETPNYKRIDIAPEFEAQLKRAAVSGDVSSLNGMMPSLAQDTTATAANRDGNTVQLDQELLALSQNTLAHTLETQVASGALAKMRLAITGRP